MKIYPSTKQDRETLMQETRESRLLLWEMLRLRYLRRRLIEKPIPVDEILPELKQVLNTLHGRNKKTIFKTLQRLRLWPPRRKFYTIAQSKFWNALTVATYRVETRASGG